MDFQAFLTNQKENHGSMEKIRELKRHLASLKFPGINDMNDDQLKYLFSLSNRRNLVAWLFEGLYPGIEDLWSTEEELANLVYQHGFCTSSNKLKFMTGSDEFSEDDQMIILKKILFVLLVIKQQFENEKLVTSSNYQTWDKLEMFLSHKINIFPDSDLLRRKTTEECVDDLIRCKEEIEELKNEISELEMDESLNVICDLNQKKLDLQQLDRLDDAMNCSQYALQWEPERKPLTFDIDQEHLTRTSSECCDALNNVLQCLDDQETVSTFSESLSSMSTESISSDDTIKRMQHLLEISEKIANIPN